VIILANFSLRACSQLEESGVQNKVSNAVLTNFVNHDFDDWSYGNQSDNEQNCEWGQNQLEHQTL